MRNELIEILKNEKQFCTLGIRTDDVEYNIGDVVNESYRWNHEMDCSSYDTEDPESLGGTCATSLRYPHWDYGVDMEDAEEVEELIDDIIATYEYNTSIYSGAHVYLVVGGWNIDNAEDEREVVVADAKVLYKF